LQKKTDRTIRDGQSKGTIRDQLQPGKTAAKQIFKKNFDDDDNGIN